MQVHTFISLSILMLLGSGLSGATITWTGEGGDHRWHTTSNWSPERLPGPDDTALFEFSTYVTTYVPPPKVKAIKMTGGITLTLRGPIGIEILSDMTIGPGQCLVLMNNPLSIRTQLINQGCLTIKSGGINGGGSIRNEGGAAIITMSGPGSKGFDHLKIHNYSKILVTGTGPITSEATFIIENYAGSVFELSGDTDFSPSPSVGTIRTRGEFVKSSGSGVSDIWTTLHFLPGSNIDVQSGTLRLHRPQYGEIPSFKDVTYHVGGGTNLQLETNVRDFAFAGNHQGDIQGSFVMYGIGGNGGGIIASEDAVFNFTANGFTWKNGAFKQYVNEGKTFRNVGKFHAVGNAAKNISDGLTFENTGDMTIDEGGLFLRLGGRGTKFINTGRFSILSDLDFPPQSSHGKFFNQGLFEKSGGAGVTDVHLPFVNQEGGRISVRSGTICFLNSLSLLAGGTVQGNGVIHLTNTVVFDGNIAPGSSTGMLTLQGNFEPSATAKTEIEIGAKFPAPYSDQLKVIGDANLAGTLQVQFNARFEPQYGREYPILNTTGSLSGQFDQVKVISIRPIEVSTHRQGNTIFLRVESLPVVISSLTARQIKYNVQLAWALQNTQYLRSLILEHKTRLKQEFVPIFTYESDDTSNTIPPMEYLHTEVPRGSNYYRLRVSNVQGQETTSDTFHIDVEY